MLAASLDRIVDVQPVVIAAGPPESPSRSGRRPVNACTSGSQAHANSVKSLRCMPHVQRPQGMSANGQQTFDKRRGGCFFAVFGVSGVVFGAYAVGVGRSVAVRDAA